jgi:hypothetical protein
MNTLVYRVLAPVIFSIIWAQEIILHSLGLPHLEASTVDPFVIKHTCDSCCEWVSVRLGIAND